MVSVLRRSLPRPRSRARCLLAPRGPGCCFNPFTPDLHPSCLFASHRRSGRGHRCGRGRGKRHCAGVPVRASLCFSVFRCSSRHTGCRLPCLRCCAARSDECLRCARPMRDPLPGSASHALRLPLPFSLALPHFNSFVLPGSVAPACLLAPFLLLCVDGRAPPGALAASVSLPEMPCCSSAVLALQVLSCSPCAVSLSVSSSCAAASSR
jgi:hypothetical protein